MTRSTNALSLLVKSLVVFATVGSAALTSAGAQTPRFGPDEGRFKVTTTMNSSSSIMGMAMDMGMDVELLVSVKITAAGKDTLLFRAVVDSAGFKLNSPMMERMGLSADDLAPYSQGDSAVFLISSGGAMLKLVAGDESLREYFALTKGFPTTLAPGASWTFSTLDSASAASVTADMGGAGGGAMAGLMGGLTQAMGTTTITYQGPVDRQGARAWKFVSSAVAPTKSVPMPEMNATVTVKSLSGTGEMFLDLTGKLLHRSYQQETEQEISMQGMVIGSTSSATLLVERIR